MELPGGRGGPERRGDRKGRAAGRRPLRGGASGGRLKALNPTPVIDTLAAEGALFENCFVVNSICVPSRACIMTGQHNHINGCHTLGGKLPPERQYLAIEMRPVADGIVVGEQ